MNPKEIYRTFLEAGTDWADKHGAAELLEAGLKPLKAQLTIEAKNLESCSMAEASEIALSASVYTDAQIAAVNARTEANRAKVRYESVKALFEAQRTAEASERSAMRAAT